MSKRVLPLFHSALPDKFIEKTALTLGFPLNTVEAFVSGLFVGSCIAVFTRYFGRYIFWILLSGSLSLWTCYYYGFISFNENMIQNIFGFSVHSVDDITYHLNILFSTYKIEIFGTCVAYFIVSRLLNISRLP